MAAEPVEGLEVGVFAEEVVEVEVVVVQVGGEVVPEVEVPKDRMAIISHHVVVEMPRETLVVDVVAI